MATFSLGVLRAESKEVKGTKGTQHSYLALCRWRGIFSYRVNPLGCEICPLKANTPFGEREHVVSKKRGFFFFFSYSFSALIIRKQLMRAKGKAKVSFVLCFISRFQSMVRALGFYFSFGEFGWAFWEETL